MRFVLVCLFWVWAQSAYTQNLVPNGSLEFVHGNDSCYYENNNKVMVLNQIGWYGMYFRFACHKFTLDNCPTTTILVSDCPNCIQVCVGEHRGGNVFMPLPYHGKAYAYLDLEFKCTDCLSWGPNGWFARKFLSTKLVRPLKAGHKYTLTYFINNFATRGDKINCFDVHFSKDSLYFPQIDSLFDWTVNRMDPRYLPITNTGYDLAHQTHPATIRYTGEPLGQGQWYKMEATFTAQGGEEHMTFGCLRDTLDYILIKGNPLNHTSEAGIRTAIDSITLREWVNQRANEQRVPTFVTATPVNPIDTTNPPPPPPPFEIPNVITPNGDGVNDYWVIDGLPEGSAVVLHNRWGNTIFSEAPYRHRFNAEGLEAGNYFYLITEPNGTFHKGPLRVIKE